MDAETEIKTMARQVGPVVVGIDGSANSRRAAVAAAKLAHDTHTTLIVVHAVGLTESIEDEMVPSFGHDREIADLVAGWCTALDEEGFDNYTSRVVDGSPVDVLVRVANDEGASVIVIGRRGSGGRPELLLGSTAHQVIEHSHTPVLVIPPIGHSATVRPPHG